MLNQVILMASTPKTLDITDVDPDEIVVIKSISGLTPPPITLFTGEYARDGGYYQGRRVQKRNAVFNLKLNPDYANDIEVSDIREMLYGWFLEPTPGFDGLQVVLKDDRKPDRYFVGFTETLDPTLFERDTSGQISMLCVDPYLLSVSQVHNTDAVGWTTTSIDYEGSAETGLEMIFKVKTAVGQMNVTINGVKMTIVKPSGNWAVNDLITINTIKGQLSVKVNGVDAMAQLSSASKWLTLTKGANAVVVYGAVLGDGKVALMEYTYRAAWWGV